MARVEMFMIAKELMQGKKFGRNEENREPIQRNGGIVEQTNGAKGRHEHYLQDEDPLLRPKNFTQLVAFLQTFLNKLHRRACSENHLIHVRFSE